MAIDQNVAARHAANTLMDLGITLAKEEGLEPEQVRRMWLLVIEYAECLIGGRDPEPEPKKVSVAEEYSTGGHDLDDELMPWGKFEGQRFCDVPEWYWSWLSEQDWIENWPELSDYISENGLG